MLTDYLIQTERELRQLIPPYPKMLDKRIQTTLDQHCLEFLEHSKIVAVAFSHNNMGFTYINLSHGQLTINSPINISFHVAMTNEINATENLSQSPNCSLYFFIPGIGHGVRVNGVAAIQTNSVGYKLSIDIKAIYFQCSRAAVRGGLWTTPTVNNNPILLSNAESFVEQSPFLLIRTQNKEGNTEISPRGDSPGFTKYLDQHSLLIPERPGNKVAISLRNILNNNHVAVSFLIPGSDQTLSVFGTASLTQSAELLSLMSVNGKIPKLGILIKISGQKIVASHGLKAAELWDNKNHLHAKQLTSFPKVIAEHMNGTGWRGKASTPIIKAVVTHDLKHLY